MKKSSPYHVLLALICAQSILLCSCGSTNVSDPNSNRTAVVETDADPSSVNESFDALMHEYFQESLSGSTINTNYTVKYPENYGIVQEEASWGSISLTKEDFAEDQAAIQDYLDRLHTIGRPDGSRAITYDIFEYEMENALAYYKNNYIYMENNLQPTIGFHSQLPTTMAEYHFDDVDDVEDYLILLETLDEYVTDLMSYETDKAIAGYGMCRSALEKSIEECQAFIEEPDSNMLLDIFPDKLAEVDGLTDSEVNDYIERNEKAVKNDVINAYEIMIDGMEAQLPTAPKNGSLSSYSRGKDYYRYLLKSSVGTDQTPEELITLTEDKINEDVLTLALLLQVNPDLFDEVETLEYPYTEPDEIIDYFKETMTAELMPECPDASYTIKEVHSSLKDSVSPAMYFLPRVDDTSENIIYTNIGGNESVNELMPTMAHEGYPGHMYQFIYYYNTRPNPVRTLLECSGYIEGWASYVENLSYAYCGFSDDAAQFCMAYDDMTQNLYCRLDLGIHYEGWDVDKTAEFLEDYLAIDSETTQTIYETILYNPTNYLVYGIGMDEINLLKEDMETLYETENETSDETLIDESFDLVDFHKQFLDIGPAPFPIIRKYMLGE